MYICSYFCCRVLMYCCSLSVQVEDSGVVDFAERFHTLVQHAGNPYVDSRPYVCRTGLFVVCIRTIVCSQLSGLEVIVFVPGAIEFDSRSVVARQHSHCQSRQVVLGHVDCDFFWPFPSTSPVFEC